MTTVSNAVFPFDTRNDLDAEPEYAQLRESDPVPRVELVTGGAAYLATRYADPEGVRGQRIQPSRDR
jgi:hypothetical protein